MKRGKYAAPRKFNPLVAIFWILLTICIILGCILLFRSCGAEEPVTPPPPQVSVQTQPSQAPATEPDTQPVTEPVTVPTTEPVTEPTTAPTPEPTTEPTTEPTEPEPSTEPTEPEPDDTPTTENTLGAAVVTLAKEQLGKPYAAMGAGPDNFDTSGLITYCYQQQGITLPHRTSGLVTSGVEIAKEDLQPGDVVFFYQNTEGKAEYPGIYTGNGTFIAVSSSQNAVVERSMTSNYYTQHYVTARRYGTN